MEKEEIKISWFTKLLLKFWPNLAMKRFAKKIWINNSLFDKAHELFLKVKRIDFLPTGAETRGFVLVLNRKTALYFYQDGDHFAYDGYEMGEYEKGDVTIFDNITSLGPISMNEWSEDVD